MFFHELFEVICMYVHCTFFDGRLGPMKFQDFQKKTILTRYLVHIVTVMFMKRNCSVYTLTSYLYLCIKSAERTLLMKPGVLSPPARKCTISFTHKSMDIKIILH